MGLRVVKSFAQGTYFEVRLQLKGKSTNTNTKDTGYFTMLYNSPVLSS
jgi:hypothetical protein